MLEKIQKPNDIKKIPADQLPALAEEIRKFIIHTLRSGATIYNCAGAYDNQPRQEIITIVDKNEYAQLMSFILKTDPKAFVTVYTVNEIIYRPKY